LLQQLPVLNLPPDKIQRLIDVINRLVRHVDRHRSLTITHRIDDSYYMQKSEELRLLLEKLMEHEEKMRLLQSRICSRYQEVFYQWKGDYRWLNKHLRNVPESKVES